MLEVSLNQLMKHMGTRLILKDINFSVYENDRVGLIGANGSGKSTILKLIAGIEKLKLFPGSWSPGYDYGWISVPRSARVGYLDQLPTYEASMTVKDVIDKAFEEVYKIEKDLRYLETKMAKSEGEDLEKILRNYGKLSDRFESLGGYEVKEKTAKVCTGLGLTDAFLNQLYSALSGGEKTRVELGKLLIEQPEILLLDEPTNHLDTSSIEWLEAFLIKYKGIVMVVSHDRAFLDAVTNKTLEIEYLTTYLYNGNYSKYKYLKDEKLRVQLDHYNEQKKQIESMEKQVRELREWANKSDNNKFYQRAQSIQIKLDKMVRIKKPIFKRKNMRLSFDDVSRSGKDVIRATQVSKSFGQKVILNQTDLLVRYGERVALLGENGCGKSTFVKLLQKELIPDHGVIELGDSVQSAYLPQVIRFEDENKTVLDTFRADEIIEEGKAREYLAKFMFYGKTVYTHVGGLSGGERIRLKLAKLLYKKVNLLILDEPTNHLDIESIETLEEALDNFTGTILFISHDRAFIKRASKRILSIEDGKLVSYMKGYDHYRDFTKAKNNALDGPVNTPQGHTESQGKQKQRLMNPTKMNSSKINKKSSKPKSINIEKEISKIEEEITYLETALEETVELMEKHAKDHERLEELYKNRLKIENELGIAWQKYESLGV